MPVPQSVPSKNFLGFDNKYLPDFMSGISSALGSLFSKNPYSEAMPYIEQIPSTMKPYYDPYIQAGTRALGSAENQYNRLTTDPTQLMSQFGSQYTSSPGYQWQVGEATKAANQAAAARGMAGRPAEQAELAQYISGIAGRDYQDFLGQALGLYGRGLSGYENLYGTGARMGDSLATSLANVLASQADLAQKQAEAENENNSGLFGGLASIFLPFIK
jgi:hypothetical protein